MQILHAVVGADAQVVAGECYVVGVSIDDLTGDGLCAFYNENASSKTAAQLFCTLRCTDETQFASMMFPMPGLKCDGVYADWTSGAAYVYYYR